MFVVALTGGIGSGKSTVATLFAEKGITVIDTDQLAKDLTQPNSATLNAIVKKFGDDILFPDHSLNRASLRKKIFADIDARLFLEKLLHPLIREETQRQAVLAESPYCIVVIPLLFETEPNPIINHILVIDVPEETQIERTTKRDHLSRKEILAILKAQVTRKERLEGADDVILNQGTREALIPEVEKLHQKYLQMSITP